jgi:steroid delta-isomerase-like uncharacterized protein
MELSPEAVVRGFFEALNRRDYARAQACIAEHCQWESLGSHTVRVGPAAAIAGLREVTTAFPDWRAELHRVITSGACVVVEWSTTGTFDQPFRDRKPNGKSFRRRGCAVAEVVDGRIARYRDYFDRAILLQQLDLIDLL